MHNRPTVLRLLDLDFDSFVNASSNGWSIQHIHLRTEFFEGETYAPDRYVVCQCQLPPEAGLAARLKKPTYGMNDAPRNGGIDWMLL